MCIRDSSKTEWEYSHRQETSRMLCNQPVGKFMLFFAGVVMKNAKKHQSKSGGGLDNRRAHWASKVGARAHGPNRSLRLCIAALYQRLPLEWTSFVRTNGSKENTHRQRYILHRFAAFAELTTCRMIYDYDLWMHGCWLLACCCIL